MGDDVGTVWAFAERMESVIVWGMSSPFVWVKAAALLWALALTPMALTGLFCVVTWRGAALFASVIAIGVGPLLWCIGDERESERQKRLGSVVVWIGLLLFSGLAATVKGSQPHEGARVVARFSAGGWPFERFSIGNLLPEIDQIHLGYLGARLLDPLFNRQQLAELSAMTDDIYQQLNKDDDFRKLGSALPWMWREIAFSDFRSGHYFHYVPAGLDRQKPIPTLVFLHGSGGNFLAYAWLLSKVSEQSGCAIIAPTFGMGNWEKRGAYDAIKAAISDAGRFQAIDWGKIHLMGLSNGGKGVCLADSSPGPKFQSLIFLSAVWSEKIPPRLLAQRLGERPVLILSGGRDERVPWDYVAGYANALQGAGMKVSIREFPEDDHFLFFRRKKKVEEELVRWLSLPFE